MTQGLFLNMYLYLVQIFGNLIPVRAIATHTGRNNENMMAESRNNETTMSEIRKYVDEKSMVLTGLRTVERYTAYS